MTAFGDGNWKQPSAEDKTPRSDRRHKRMLISRGKLQQCQWHGCEEKPIRSGKPYCLKHHEEAMRR